MDVNQQCGRALGVVAPAVGNANVQTHSLQFGTNAHTQCAWCASALQAHSL